ncbi:MAG: bifunctional 4-hydroxy-2-oxoglutarate aldolase/2-dehydro-3-deoxy-phosphogluconate aldolase [Caulobacterales bacterium]|jgi:2-dehydro-3-deoxyphosphogluconate aldolase/(4S)-4-hydroxy-2-oxoglutarate aldolase
MRTVEEIAAQASVIPVLVVEDVGHAAPLAVALQAGGLRVVELTLRTPAALAALVAMKAAAPDLVVGMGTVLDAAQAQAAVAAGADFLVSPGATPELLAQFRALNIAALPGVATVSEAMAARAAGFRTLKFFPAEPAGGPAYVSAMAGPLPDLSFCPTGGIGRERAKDYLKLSNVVCVGGSWIATAGLLAAGDFAAITENARYAQSLKSTA